jgi:hypothetical protein
MTVIWILVSAIGLAFLPLLLALALDRSERNKGG